MTQEERLAHEELIKQVNSGEATIIVENPRSTTLPTPVKSESAYERLAPVLGFLIKGVQETTTGEASVNALDYGLSARTLAARLRDIRLGALQFGYQSQHIPSDYNLANLRFGERMDRVFAWDATKHKRLQVNSVKTLKPNTDCITTG